MTSRGFFSMLFPAFGLVTLMAYMSNYISSRWKLMVPIMLFVYFFGQVAGGGRAQSVLSFGYVLTFLFLSYRYANGLGMTNQVRRRGVRKKKKRCLMFVVAVLFFVLLYYLFQNTDYFYLLTERAFGGEGTGREDITDAMIKDFNNTPIDWLVGRGINGSYAYAGDTGGTVSGRREYMEWGFLQMILKGGIIYLLLSTLLLARAVFQGFRRSKNLLCKAMAAMCFWQIVGLSCGVSEAFVNVRYAIIWFCVGCLENKKIRMMSDNEIYLYFNYTRKNEKLKKTLSRHD